MLGEGSSNLPESITSKQWAVTADGAGGGIYWSPLHAPSRQAFT